MADGILVGVETAAQFTDFFFIHGDTSIQYKLKATLEIKYITFRAVCQEMAARDLFSRTNFQRITFHGFLPNKILPSRLP